MSRRGDRKRKDRRRKRGHGPAHVEPRDRAGSFLGDAGGTVLNLEFSGVLVPFDEGVPERDLREKTEIASEALKRARHGPVVVT